MLISISRAFFESNFACYLPNTSWSRNKMKFYFATTEHIIRNPILFIYKILLAIAENRIVSFSPFVVVLSSGSQTQTFLSDIKCRMLMYYPNYLTRTISILWPIFSANRGNNFYRWFPSAVWGVWWFARLFPSNQGSGSYLPFLRSRKWVMVPLGIIICKTPILNSNSYLAQ